MLFWPAKIILTKFISLWSYLMSSYAGHKEMNGSPLMYDTPLVLSRPVGERLCPDVTVRLKAEQQFIPLDSPPRVIVPTLPSAPQHAVWFVLVPGTHTRPAPGKHNRQANMIGISPYLGWVTPQYLYPSCPVLYNNPCQLPHCTEDTHAILLLPGAHFTCKFS